MRKKAFVTGSSRGIGRGIAVELTEAGYDVAINYHNAKKEAEQTASDVMKSGGSALVIQGDISRLGDIDRMFDQYESAWKTLDLMVNNAGITRIAPFLESTPQLWEEVINTDLRGTFFCSQRAAKIMVKNDTKGVIINNSSNHSEGCWRNFTIYAAGKAAINKLTKNMALELSDYGIRVVGIAPGYTKVRDDYPEGLYESVSGKTPMRRWATCGEIGKAVVFLASDDAGFITGTTLFIDGGALLPIAIDCLNTGGDRRSCSGPMATD